MPAHWLLVAAALVSVIVPNGDHGANPAGTTGVTAAGRFVDGVFTADAGTRRWKLWVPSGYDAARPSPMVVMLHGCTQDPEDVARGSRATEYADPSVMLVLFPEQPDSANPKKCWSWYDPAHQRRDAGEPSLIAGMTRQAMSAWSVDSARVYVAGISAGAAMASIMAVTYPDLYAAVGLHSGIPFGAARNVMEGVGAMANGAADTARLARAGYEAMGARARPVPAIIVQGMDDAVVRVVNAKQTRDAWLAMNALARGAKPEPAGRPITPGRVFTAQAGGLEFWRECHGAKTTERYCEVETLLVAGLGHAWSGGSTLGTFADERGPNATVEIFRFLLAHRMSGTAPSGR